MTEDFITGPAYRIHTDRLVIRCWQPSDAPLLKQAVEDSLDHLQPWMDWAHQEPTDLTAKINLIRTFRGNFDLNRDYTYGIFNKKETQVLGGTGLHTRLTGSAFEIGYWIHKNHTRQGYAIEATIAMVQTAFEVEQVDRIEIHCDPRNLASAAIPRKFGFTHEATLKHRLRDVNGNLRDTMIWTMFKDEYHDSAAAAFILSFFDAMGREITL